jgi:hypothetical protein
LALRQQAAIVRHRPIEVRASLTLFTLPKPDETPLLGQREYRRACRISIAIAEASRILPSLFPI